MERLTAHARKVLTISAGAILLAAGIVLLILPGPGIPLILVGLTLLGAHFAWARRLRERAVSLGKRALVRIRRFSRSRFSRAPRPPAKPSGPVPEI